jgi:hypothetical protein
MIQENTLRKISDMLIKGIQDECQVVYILSQMVIILEEKDLEENYPYLLLYRNWTVHNKLSYPTTVNLLLDIFKNDIDSRISAHKNARNLIKTNSRFFKLDILKKEFIIFFKEHDLTLDLLNTNWSSFKKLLLEVIKGRSVEFNSEILKKLELTEDENGKYCYKFSLVGMRDKPMVKFNV